MPFFGVPIRNGLPIGLGSVAGFGVQQFDPSELFAGGTVAGAWYDPSDLSTLFTTSAGTTPVAMPGGGAAVSVGRMLDKSGNGNHAIAFNDTTARPELRARVNLLTYSEEFDNGDWTKSDATVTANQIIAPDGTLTADRLFETAASSTHFINSAQTLTLGTQYTATIRVKKGTGVDARRYVQFRFRGAPFGNTSGIVFDFDTGTAFQFNSGFFDPLDSFSVSNIGSGWYLLSITNTATVTSADGGVVVVLTDSNSQAAAFPTYTGSTNADVYIWGADLRPANIGANVPAYQRIADANTYDTSGFPLYLRFDGIDDSMYTPANLNLSGTDKVAVFAGVRKLSDAAQGVVAELSATIASNNGTFLLAAPDGATQTYGWDSKGTTQVDAVASSLAAPRTNVLVGTADIAGDSCIIRVNGAVADTEAGDQGSGNYGTYPLYIGARNNSSLWLNGQVYGLLVVGSAVSAGNISATEQWVAQKTGLALP